MSSRLLATNGFSHTDGEDVPTAGLTTKPDHPIRALLSKTSSSTMMLFDPDNINKSKTPWT